MLMHAINSMWLHLLTLAAAATSAHQETEVLWPAAHPRLAAAKHLLLESPSSVQAPETTPALCVHMTPPPLRRSAGSAACRSWGGEQPAWCSWNVMHGLGGVYWQAQPEQSRLALRGSMPCRRPAGGLARY